jgi:uncharacterized Tic20 family protein
MDAASSQDTHDPQTCMCHPCQTARYESQYGAAPTAQPVPPLAPPGYGTGYAQQPGFPPPTTQPGFPPQQAGFPPTGSQQPSYPPPYPQQAPNPERTVAALAHWLPAAVAFLFSLIFAFFGLSLIAVILAPIAPIVIYGTAKSPFVREHARESMNFQLTVVIPGLLFGILAIFTVAGAILGLLLFVACLIPQIMGAIKAGTGEGFRYPIAIPYLAAAH